ncbi:MAG TPA: RodZ domain-containing protein [Alphaproteobacteria bacterium]|nr:RodZ domain-containing protein [Alphaproteobacteria bacterium]
MTNTALQLEFPQNEPLTVGQILKESRLSQGLTLEEVARTLCISKRHLVQFEEDHENLVCDVYTLGFLKSYVQFLGLDDKKLSKIFKNQAGCPPPSLLHFPATSQRAGLPSKRILIFSIFLLLAIIVGWEGAKYYDARTHPPKVLEAVETPAESDVTDRELENLEDPAPLADHRLQDSMVRPEVNFIKEPTLDSQTTVSPQSVLLKATEKTWVQVTNLEGITILTRTLQPGETYELKDPQHLVLKTGNAGGLSLISNEKSIRSLGTSGEIVRGISLDPEKWVEQTPDTH